MRNIGIICAIFGAFVATATLSAGDARADAKIVVLTAGKDGGLQKLHQKDAEKKDVDPSIFEVDGDADVNLHVCFKGKTSDALDILRAINKGSWEIESGSDRKKGDDLEIVYVHKKHGKRLVVNAVKMDKTCEKGSLSFVDDEE